jgi:hypothetical protein
MDVFDRLPSRASGLQPGGRKRIICVDWRLGHLTVAESFRAPAASGRARESRGMPTNPSCARRSRAPNRCLRVPVEYPIISRRAPGLADHRHGVKPANGASTNRRTRVPGAADSAGGKRSGSRPLVAPWSRDIAAADHATTSSVVSCSRLRRRRIASVPEHKQFVSEPRNRGALLAECRRES